MPTFRINGKSLLFIHVPKTGGTALEHVLGQFAPMGLHDRRRPGGSFLRAGLLSKPIPMQHLHAEMLERFFDPLEFDRIFMVVRDPVQRMISEYRHARALDRPESRLGFGPWLRISLAAARLDRAFRNNHFRPQSEFCFGDAKVYHFEDGLLQAANAIAKFAGVPGFADVPRARGGHPYPVQVRESERQLIAKFFFKDYAAFPRYNAAAADAPQTAQPAEARRVELLGSV